MYELEELRKIESLLVDFLYREGRLNEDLIHDALDRIAILISDKEANQRINDRYDWIW
jgi:hypothetical protein